jgi:carbamoyl-phosphate synthase large subunit
MKALTISTLPVELTAIDIDPLSGGLFRAPNKAVLPKPENPGGLEKWEEYVLENGIEALIPGSDHDLIPLASVREEWANKGICQVLVSDLDLVRVCRDKALTCQLLAEKGLPKPKSAWDLSATEALSWAKSIGYPVVLKPRDGFASRDLHVVKDEEELSFFYPRTPNPILQEHLSLHGKVDEYTCAVFVDDKGSPTATFMARRDLSNGTTYRAEINFWPEIHELLEAIGSALKPRGLLNVQLRQTERGPVPFELNIRCSGTTAMRAYYGYNEPEMMLRHYVLGERIDAPQIRTGYAYRYWNEIFLEGLPVQDSPDERTGEILAWP